MMCIYQECSTGKNPFFYFIRSEKQSQFLKSVFHANNVVNNALFAVKQNFIVVLEGMRTKSLP